MTNKDKEQTISNLKKLKSFHNGSYGADIDRAIKALEQEPCEDCISKKSLKHKLQEHHDFFVNAYGGFSNLPPNDKSRVDEITNCIAMVVNEPPVNLQPKTGHWMKQALGYQCSNCTLCTNEKGRLTYNYCPNCGAKMVEQQKSEGKE